MADPDSTDQSIAPTACTECLVARYTVYGRLKAERLDTITALRRGRQFLPANKFIFREGETPQVVYTLFDGWAYKYKVVRNRGRQILMFYLPGDLILAQAVAEAPLPFAVKSATPVALCSFDRSRYFETMAGSEETSSGLRDYRFARYNETDDLLAAIGRLAAQARLSHLLLSLAIRISQRHHLVGDGIRIPLGQTLIADALGLTNVYVNRVLSYMRRRGVVEVERGVLHILDLDALKELSEGD